MTAIQDIGRSADLERQPPFVIANGSRGATIDALARDAKQFSRTLRGMRDPEFNAVAHVYTSAQWTIKFGSHAARNAGNKKEEGAKLSQRLDSMKDQYNNALGRRIGEYVSALVQQFPKFRGREQEMMESLIREAWAEGQMANTENDPRVGELFKQNVDPQMWLAADDHRVSWQGPSRAFSQFYGWVHPNATRQRPLIGY